MNMRMRATAPKGMTRPEGEDGHRLLNTVWQQFAQSKRWPTFELIDRALYRDGFEFEAAVQQLPAGLLLGIDPDMKRRPPQPDQELRLSLAGAVHCDDAAAEVKAFIGLVRLAGVVERDWETALDDSSAPSHPYIDPDVLRSHPAFDPGVFPPSEVLYRAAHLTSSEPWTSGLGFRCEELYWCVSFDRRIRPFAAVTGLAEYWKVRTSVLPPELDAQHVPVPVPAVSAPVVAPQATPAFALSIPLHPGVAAVAAERFEKGQFTDAVLRAFQAVEHRVQVLSGLSEVGARLMGMALGSAAPKLVVTRATGASLQSEREGFRDLFKGAMEALRNPRAHGPHFADDPEEAQEMLALANLLMRRLDDAEARLNTQPTLAAGTP
ncbi:MULTISPECIES: TIGR02391 family protein [unclassified Streptomyces]|uniref:TIGR02391 family protein n=1 Tax=unclassified Streptomyces TaxID=2593676 RepID=UPI001F4F4615|nr:MULTISPECIES: TIGR02391 family protein [unclassified Streptomyces]